MRAFLHLLGVWAFASILSDMWAQAIVPLGAVPVPPFSVFGLLLILGLFRISFRSDRELFDLTKEVEAMDSDDKNLVLIVRLFTLAFSYGLFRIVGWLAEAVTK